MTYYKSKVFLTPEIASQWLELNADNNRPPKHSKIPVYAEDMLYEQWNEDTGETIKFDTSGRLVDGQNRLRAVVMAKMILPFKGEDGRVITEFKGVHFDVAYDVPPEAMLVMDSGSARTFADAIAVASSDRFGSASVVRWVMLWERGIFIGKGGGFNPSHTMLWKRHQKDVELFELSRARGIDCARELVANGSAYGVAHFLFSKIDAEQTRAFFDSIVSGADLGVGHPALTLRKRMGRVKVDRIKRHEQLALIIRAWNAFRRDERVSQILITTGHDRGAPLTNDNFPMPK
jgi:hypothetical protein